MVDAGVARVARRRGGARVMNKTAAEKITRWLGKRILVTMYFGEDYECTRAERFVELIACETRNEEETTELKGIASFLKGAVFVDPEVKRAIESALGPVVARGMYGTGPGIMAGVKLTVREEDL